MKTKSAPSKNNNVKTVHVQEQHLIAQNIYSGPIPPPEHLEKYSQIYPDAPKRIFDLAEKNQQFDFEQKNKVLKLHEKELDNNANITKRGQYLVFYLSFGFLIAATVCILLDKEIAAGIFSLIPFSVILKYLLPNKK